MNDTHNFRALSSILLAATALLVLLSCPAFPQSAGTGTLTGTVTDSSGAVVPAAAVVVHNGDTGADREVTSNGSPGPYRQSNRLGRPRQPYFTMISSSGVKI
jgi:hypothetical protein